MGQQGGRNNKGGMNNIGNKPDHSTTTDNSTSTNTDIFTPPSNDTLKNAMNAPNYNTMNNSPGNMGGNASNLDPTVIMEAMQIIQSSEDGTITDSIKGKLLNLGLTEDDITQLSSMELPNQDNNMQDFKNTNLAMGPNNTSSNNTSLIITLSSIALLVIAIIGVSLFKKRKYIS